MAHQLDESNNRFNMAFTKELPWHGLGQKLEEGAPIEQWIEAAGLDWDVLPSKTYLRVGNRFQVIEGRKSLFRSDTEAPLAIVSKGFHIVQPREVVEFFRDLVEEHNMKLSTAGSLFGGTRFWALAELGKDFEVVNGDKVNGNLLLTTAVDGSMHTTAKFVSTRVVCNNTLTVALNENVKNLVKVSHRSAWDPKQVKIDLGLIDASWDNFITNVRLLANAPITDAQATTFFTELLTEDLRVRDQKADKVRREEKKVENLLGFFHNGQGADFAKNTYWNAVNAVTECYTYGTGRRDPSHQFWDSNYGGSDDLKTRALLKAIAEVA